MFVGVDLGGTKTRAGVVKQDGSVVGTSSVPTPGSKGAADVLQAVVHLVRDLVERLDVSPLAIGVGGTGVMDARHGRVVGSTLAITGWAGTEIVSRLEDDFGVPVYLDNDVNCFGIGEYLYGAARGSGSVLAVTVGTGVGGAIITEGTLWRGVHSSVGEIGHIPLLAFSDRMCPCGRFGHLEAVSSGPAMVDRFAGTGGKATDFRGVVTAAQNGGPAARSVINEGAATLGAVLAGLANAFDPELLVVGGGVTSAGHTYWAPLTRAYHDALLPVCADTPMVRAQLGDNAILVGSACLAVAELGHSSTRLRRLDAPNDETTKRHEREQTQC